MKNPELFKKLMTYAVNPPENYQKKITDLYVSKGFSDLVDPTIFNIEQVRKAGGLFSAKDVVGIFLHMYVVIKQKQTTTKLKTFKDMIPSLITVVIPDERIRKESISFLISELD